MDPTMAKALAKCWPDLVSAFKEQQQAQPDGKDAKATSPPETLTNDEMEDINDEVKFAHQNKCRFYYQLKFAVD